MKDGPQLIFLIYIKIVWKESKINNNKTASEAKFFLQMFKNKVKEGKIEIV